MKFNCIFLCFIFFIFFSFSFSLTACRLVVKIFLFLSFFFSPQKKTLKREKKFLRTGAKTATTRIVERIIFFFFLFFFVCVAAILVAISSQFDFVYVHGVEKTELEEISISSIERPSNSFG